MKKYRKSDIVRIILFIGFILIMIGVTIALLPHIKLLMTEEGRIEFQQKLNSFGIWKFVIFVLCQVLQIIFAFIPGEPFEIISGVMFGWLGGLFMCMIGILIGTACVYYLVKLLGRPFVNAIISEEKLKKFKFLNDSRKLELITFLLFLIPGTPKDALVYFVPFTTIKPSRFFTIATLARIPSVVSSVLVGSTLNGGNWVWSIIILLLTGAIGVIGIWYNSKLMKKFDESERIQREREKWHELSEKLRSRQKENK